MSYGVTIDYFGLGDTHWRPQTGAKNPTAAGEAQAVDSFGDVQASTVHGKAKAFTSSYEIVDGDSGVNFNINTHVKLGNIIAIDTATKAVVTGVNIETANVKRPMITVSGPQFFGDSVGQPTFTIPGATALKAIKQAQAMGVVVATTNRLNTCSLNASLQVVNTADSLGVFVQTDVYQGRAEVTAEAVNASAAPAITADSGWTLAKDQDVNTSNTEYGKGVLNVFKNIVRD